MEHQPDRIDVEELVERLKGLAAEGALIHTFSWGLVVSLLSDAATALSALKKERDEARASRAEAARLMAYYAHEAGQATGRLEMSEAAGIVEGWRERAQAAETELSALKALVGRMVEGLEEVTDALEAEVKARAGGELPRRIARDLEPVVRARSLLSEAKGEAG